MKRFMVIGLICMVAASGALVPAVVERGKRAHSQEMASEWRALSESLLLDKPYFGKAMAAGQAQPRRMAHFPDAVKMAANKGSIRILEIGSWAGQSTVAWAEAARLAGLDFHVSAIDPWLPYFDEDVNSGEWYREMNRTARQGTIYRLFLHNVSASGFAGQIEPLVGTTSEVAPSLPAASFDLIFIDGSHAYEDVLVDIRAARRLIRPGGIICGDDLEATADDIGIEKVRSLAASGVDYTEGFHPGVTLAVHEGLGSVESLDGFWLARGRGKGWR